MNELIQQARKCAVCMIGADECHRESCKIDNCADTIDLLADALEAARKEIERLNMELTLSKARENPQELFPELTTQQRAENAEIVALTTRAEKAEANASRLINQMEEYKQKFNTALVRAEKAKAERDAANKCIYDTETYFDLGANKFAYRTIKQYTHDAAPAPKGE